MSFKFEEDIRAAIEKTFKGNVGGNGRGIRAGMWFAIDQVLKEKLNIDKILPNNEESFDEFLNAKADGPSNKELWDRAINFSRYYLKKKLEIKE